MNAQPNRSSVFSFSSACNSVGFGSTVVFFRSCDPEFLKSFHLTTPLYIINISHCGGLCPSPHPIGNADPLTCMIFIPLYLLESAVKYPLYPPAIRSANRLAQTRAETVQISLQSGCAGGYSISRLNSRKSLINRRKRRER